MFNQTIALFRYQLVGILNRKLLVVLAAIVIAAFMFSRFVAELAIINSQSIALASLAELLRYSLLLMLVISICHQISQDYELGQFERLLAMPISRGQYVVAQFLVLLALALVFVTPMFLMMLVLSDYSIAGYWSLAVLLELLLVGQIAVLAIISLEKLPVAVLFTIALYLLARAMPYVDLIFTQSTGYYQDETGFQFAESVFFWMQYLFPGVSAFAQNNIIFEARDLGGLLGKQLVTVVIYGLFIQFIILIDFYRKEYNRS